MTPNSLKSKSLAMPDACDLTYPPTPPTLSFPLIDAVMPSFRHLSNILNQLKKWKSYAFGS